MSAVVRVQVYLVAGSNPMAGSALTVSFYTGPSPPRWVEGQFSRQDRKLRCYAKDYYANLAKTLVLELRHRQTYLSPTRYGSL